MGLVAPADTFSALPPLAFSHLIRISALGEVSCGEWRATLRHFGVGSQPLGGVGRVNSLISSSHHTHSSSYLPGLAPREWYVAAMTVKTPEGVEGQQEAQRSYTLARWQETGGAQT